MISSMTAFARRQADTPWGGLAWELRSVNHRYLDASLRLPEELRSLEPAARELIQSRLNRGKVDGNLWFEPRPTAEGLAFDSERVRRLHAAAEAVQRLAGGALAPLSAADVLRWPGVLQAPAADSEGLGKIALALLSQTLDDLVATRAREGARLGELLRTRLEAMQPLIASARALQPEIQRLYRERLEERLGEVRTQLDPQRLEQELVLFANRIDVAEELDRLEAHLGEIKRVLAAERQAGRRLDFLMQELNREANTLASKSADLRQTGAAVEIKVLIDQMREQVQNIE